MSRDDGIVWSSHGGRMCPGCGKPAAACACKAREKARPRAGGAVRVGRETQGRKGGGVSVITGLPLADRELEALARELKARCGAGGTVRAGTIEIQGEHRDLLVAELVGRGFAAKKSGS